MKDQKKHNYIVLPGAKPFRNQKDDQVSLTRKQAAAFADKLQLTDEDRKRLQLDSKLSGIRPPSVNGVKPAAPANLNTAPVENKGEGDETGKEGGEGGESSDAKPPSGPQEKGLGNLPPAPPKPSGPPT